jgi:hypothetical protein
MEKDQYLIFRYFIIPITAQMTIYDSEFSKEERMIYAIQNIFNNKKTTFQYWSTKHFLFSNFEVDNRFICLKYAKEYVRKKMVEGDYNIQEIEDLELHAAQLIFDTKHQFLLIQKKTTEFPYHDQIKNALSAYFSQQLRQYNYTIKIDEIPEKIQFWRFIEENEYINTLNLKFNAPNMLFGNSETRQALNILKDDYNIDEIDVSLKNKNNKLKIFRDNISKYIDYITSVGGAYYVKARKFGKFIILKSSENIRSIFLSKQIVADDISELQTKLDELQRHLNEDQAQNEN